MKIKYFLFIIFACYAMNSFGQKTASDILIKADTIISPDLHDFGTVTSSDQTYFTYKLINQTKQIIEISTVNAPQGILTSFEKEKIEPNESIKLIVALAPALISQKGLNNCMIKISSNHSKKIELQIKFVLK